MEDSLSVIYKCHPFKNKQSNEKHVLVYLVGIIISLYVYLVINILLLLLLAPAATCVHNGLTQIVIFKNKYNILLVLKVMFL